MQLARKKIVDAEYIMVELVDFAWGEKNHLDLDLNGDPAKGNDVHDQPPPIA